MALLGLFIGLLLGGLFWQGPGIVVGAILGWLIGREREQSIALRQLTERLTRLEALPIKVPDTPISTPALTKPAFIPDTVITPASKDIAPISAPLTEPAPPQRVTTPRQSVPPTTTAATPSSTNNPALQWLLRGNPAVKVGVLLLLMGAAFLLKYAAQYVRFPVEIRYLGVLTGAGIAAGFAWRQRNDKPDFAHALLGGALGVGFLTIFSAFRLHHLIPGGAAFALLAGLAACAGALAVKQSAQSLALIGLAGGFLAPILTSSNQGSHVALFTYYAILNLGIGWVAHARAWRSLNLLGFLFTFVIGTAWGVLRYQPSHFSSTEPFLIGFWLFYVGLSIVFTYRRQTDSKANLGTLVRDPVDASLVFGVPLVGFGLQTALVRGDAHAMAWSATSMAVVYALSWQALRHRPSMALLAQAFGILAAGFATITIPLAMGVYWTCASWALEGAGLIWLGCRQDRKLSRTTGYALIAAAGLIALAQLQELSSSDSWLSSALIASCVVWAASWLAGAAVWRNRPQSPHLPLLGWGLIIWLCGSMATVLHFVDKPYDIASTIALLAGTAALSTGLARILGWPALRLPLLGLAPLLGLVLLQSAQQQAGPLQHAGWLVWPLALLVLAGGLRYNESELPRAGRQFAHVTSTWLFGVLLVWTLADSASRVGNGSAWPWAGAMVAFGLLLAGLASRALQLRWPARRYRLTYRWHAPLPIAGLGFILLLIAPWASSGDAAPFTYLPLLNPLDLGCVLAAYGLLRWLRLPYCRRRLAPDSAAIQAILGLGLFNWLNSQLARAFHHLADQPFQASVLWLDDSYQAALALLWTLCAVVVMLIAKWRRWRALWLAGAVLIGATVLKLFLVDLAGAGSMARIVSFLGVGLLLVIIGYLAPAPSAEQDKANDQ
ncbi:DUF2339 domain-containing protein [Chitinimonas sp. BJB300]|uniref:DUF2339 domain-containing protein n=1 Tax=Chitinimonas sp. BJB300 TaxID=1559339 RepID=UPI000C0E05EB|nr:DUF2339 domain-containing protein [Chitinimonas sp. BJB300]PHV12267.1 hypothetical protein CSQ89_06675 [Chitinimonas sp. BJB300]TSJ84780.1 DUF2339 domain-containing protein [Chitinimonas sp. BJB300]